MNMLMQTVFPPTRLVPLSWSVNYVCTNQEASYSYKHSVILTTTPTELMVSDVAQSRLPCRFTNPDKSILERLYFFILIFQSLFFISPCSLVIFFSSVISLFLGTVCVTFFNLATHNSLTYGSWLSLRCARGMMKSAWITCVAPDWICVYIFPFFVSQYHEVLYWIAILGGSEIKPGTVFHLI